MREDDLVQMIHKVLSTEAPGVEVPIGDDAAVVDIGRHRALLTADMLVEGVHFTLDTTSAHELGRKAMAVNVSDVAAMGGSPRFGLVSLAIPKDTDPSWVVELYGGIREGSDDYGMTTVGGDTSRAETVVISVAVVGEAARTVTRAGARPGDRIVVTGALGAAAAGLAVVRAGPQDRRHALSTESGRAAAAAHVRPRARVGEGQTLAGAGATAMIDVSDGLALDLARLCRASEVGARLRPADVPVAEEAMALAGILRMNPLELALHGGEDYELLATLPGEAVAEAGDLLGERYGTSLTEIGEIVDTGLVAVGEDGTERPLEPRGWDHLA